jgi:hypothetical protein
VQQRKQPFVVSIIPRFFCPEPVLANDHFSEGRLKTRPCVRTVVDRISEHERRRHVMRRAGLARMWLEREGV